MQDRDPARVFGEVADEYDRVRPAYPPALADDILEYGRSARRALEVGAGTGRATAVFVARGLSVVAVEPDGAMADVLAGRVPGAQVVRSSFEDFRPAERFDLLFSAEAWHWTSPATRWSRAAEALAGDGTLALFWNTERIDDPALRASLLRVTAEHAPTVVIRDDPPSPEQTWDRWPGDELARRPEFTGLTSRHYRRDHAMPKADFLGLTRTRSQFRMLPPEIRRSLLASLTAVLDDEVPLTIDTVLVLARRLPPV